MKNIALLTLFLLCSILTFSQTYEGMCESRFKFGFNLGANYSDLKSIELLPTDASISNGGGFNFGVLMDYSISPDFIFSPKLELAFYNSSVDFINLDNSIYSYEIFPISLNIMTHFDYKIGSGNIEPYVFAGPNIKLPLSKSPPISTQYGNNSDIAIDFGIGFQNKTKHFILSPELKYSYGLTNINRNPELQTLKFNTITFSLAFSGVTFPNKK